MDHHDFELILLPLCRCTQSPWNSVTFNGVTIVFNEIFLQLRVKDSDYVSRNASEEPCVAVLSNRSIELIEAPVIDRFDLLSRYMGASCPLIDGCEIPLM